jgi:hypothetical protein
MAARRRSSAEGGYSIGLVASGLLLFAASFFLFPKDLYPAYPQMLYSLLFFLASSYFTGYSLTKGVFLSEDPIESAAMRLGFGLCALPILFVVMESAGVRLAWHVILLLSLIRPAYDFLVGLRLKVPILHVEVPRVDVYSASAFLLSAVAFSIALWGSYAYPYLEDGDSWEHSVGAKYVSLYGSYSSPNGMSFAHYLKPYPPSYDVLLGVVHQLNSSVSWTLKAFNSLLIALTYLFAFFMARRIFSDGRAALFSAFILFALPPFGSHTIWAHTLSMALLFPVFYALDCVREGKAWAILSSLFLASSLVVQPLMSAVMGVFYGSYLLARWYHERGEAKRLMAVGVMALLAALLFWTGVWLDGSTRGDLGSVVSDLASGNTQLGVGDTSNLPTASEVFFPITHGDIYMQHGFGLFAVILALLALDRMLRRGIGRTLKESPWLFVTGIWLAFTSLALFSGGWWISVYPTRFWGIAAIPLALLAGHMLASPSLLKWVPKDGSTYLVPALLIGILATSAYPKIMVQTSPWPTDLQYAVGEDFQGYLLLMQLPADTRVFPFCTKDAYVIGFDKMSLPWDPDIAAARTDPLNIDPAKLNRLLKSRSYKWALFDYGCVRKCAQEPGMSEEKCSKAFASTLKSLEDSKLFTMKWPDSASKQHGTAIFSVN